MWRPGPQDSFASDLRYMRGFMVLQDLIDTSIIQIQTGVPEHELPTIQMKQFPYPCYEEDSFQYYITAYFFPIMMTMAWIVVVANSIKSIVHDKEKRVEEVSDKSATQNFLRRWSDIGRTNDVVRCTLYDVGRTNVEDAGPTLYECYANVLCLLGY